MTPTLRWVELIGDYRCNNRCVGCFAVRDDGPRLRTSELFAALADARKRGADALWLGGGEPTLRPDLVALLREAQRLGYSRIKLQTSGLLAAYLERVRAWRDAGLTEIAFALKGHTAELHDALTQTPGAFALMCRGIEVARTEGLALEGDVLAYRDNVAALPDIVSHFAQRGLSRFRVWTFSVAAASPTERDALAGQVPSLRTVVDALAATVARFPAAAPDFLVSLHTPACAVPPALRHLTFDARAFALEVVNPTDDGRIDRFRLEDSPMEGGVYLEACARCAHRPRCNGLRAETLAREGEAPFQPISVPVTEAD